MGARATDAQWEALMLFISNDVELLHGEFTAPNGVVRVADKWKELAEVLNSIPGGATRNGEHWKKSWAKMKANARNVYSQRARYMGGTGGGPNAEVALVNLGIRPIYERVINLTGTMAAVGTKAQNPMQLQLEKRRNLAQLQEQRNEQIAASIEVNEAGAGGLVEEEDGVFYQCDLAANFSIIPPKTATMTKNVGDAIEVHTYTVSHLGKDLIEEEPTPIENTPVNRKKCLHTPPSIGPGAVAKKRLSYNEGGINYSVSTASSETRDHTVALEDNTMDTIDIKEEETDIEFLTIADTPVNQNKKCLHTPPSIGPGAVAKKRLFCNEEGKTNLPSLAQEEQYALKQNTEMRRELYMAFKKAVLNKSFFLK